jgi:hypothetical protein
MIQRFTPERSAAVVTKAALRRTALAPEKYDLPSILLDTAQGRMNTVAKRVDMLYFRAACFLDHRVSMMYRCALASLTLLITKRDTE